MKYKILINGQEYKVSMSDANDYIVANESEPIEDIIDYWVDEENLKIHASIRNPSQHTLYLISQGRCYLWLDTRMTRKIPKYRGTYTYGPGSRTNWKRGLQRKYHPYWVKTDYGYRVQINDMNNIILPFSTGEGMNLNVYQLNYVSDEIQDPIRTEYYLLFKPILVSVGIHFDSEYTPACIPNVRSYQTHSKVTKLTIQRN